MESVRPQTSRVSHTSVASSANQGKFGHHLSATVSNGSSTQSRPSLLSKAYNSVSHRGPRFGNRYSATFGEKEKGQDAFAGGSNLGVDGEGRPKEINHFSGIFPIPHPDCKPNPAPEYTEEQEMKYQDVLQHFKSLSEYPLSLKPDDKRREPLTDWEKLRMLSRESILRYLRATKWDVRQAKRRLTETIAWRREFGVECLKPEELAIEAKSGKETVLGYDKYARPVHYMHPHRNDTKESIRQMQFAVFLLERCIDMMPPGVEQLALLINFESKSRNPTSIANAKLMLYILQNHYVENLGVNWSVNVPWVFKIFWNAIQPFIDPVTKSKCHFDDPVRGQVPADQLSSDFGGDLDSKYDHDAYWPALLRITEERRKGMVRRFKESCNSEIGASEYIIRGGEDPTSPFNTENSETLTGGHDSVATSTDNSSTIAVTPITPAPNVELRDSEPLEKFTTPLDQCGDHPIERTFSSTTGTDGALEATKEVEEDVPPSPKAQEEKSDQAQAQTQSPQDHHQQHHHTANMFKEMDRKLHASKLFAAFHPDSRKQSPAPSSKGKENVTMNGSAVDNVKDGELTPESEQIPSPTAVLAVAGTAGPKAAAGAVGSIVAEQAYSGMQRVRSTAESGLAQISSNASEMAAAATTTGNTGTNDAATSKVLPSKVTLLFFAAAKEALGGKGKQILLLPTDGTNAITLTVLRDHILTTFQKDPPSEKYDGIALKKILERSKWSVDETMVDEEEMQSTLIKGDEIVAIIPPVSGG